METMGIRTVQKKNGSSFFRTERGKGKRGGGVGFVGESSACIYEGSRTESGMIVVINLVPPHMVALFLPVNHVASALPNEAKWQLFVFL